MLIGSLRKLIQPKKSVDDGQACLSPHGCIEAGPLGIDFPESLEMRVETLLELPIFFLFVVVVVVVVVVAAAIAVVNTDLAGATVAFHLLPKCTPRGNDRA